MIISKHVQNLDRFPYSRTYNIKYDILPSINIDFYRSGNLTLDSRCISPSAYRPANRKTAPKLDICVYAMARATLCRLTDSNVINLLHGLGYVVQLGHNGPEMAGEALALLAPCKMTVIYVMKNDATLAKNSKNTLRHG